ncbi:metal ABC transporter permease [Corynebacterium sp. HMSC27B11]|uniref:metal ABC transporter permease n=1 Tax=Corynebacterium sp. HMSC27B11 TaxID=1581065 RepID=UPI0008A40C48|nr:metal ABC transporter permease [Corynebacterium sp. HMSC27B11]OFS16535.1 zinc ABC transporter permease [Corynebacterium sp. HMSC27B11]
MLDILLLPIIEVIAVGMLAGLVGVFAVLNRQVFFAEAITHATFPGAVLGVVVAAALGLNFAGISALLFLGALLMCIPIGALFGLSKFGTPSAAAGIVLTSGFALGYFLNKFFAPLPVKVESFLVGSVLNVDWVDIGISLGLLAVTLLILWGGWRKLVFFAFDPEAFGVSHNRRAAQGIISALIVATLVALIPAVGTILSIALLVAPAAGLVGVCSNTRTLLIAAPLVGVAMGLVGLGVGVWADLSVGGCIGVSAGVGYLILKMLR